MKYGFMQNKQTNKKNPKQQQPVCLESEAVNITKQGCVSSLFQKCVS